MASGFAYIDKNGEIDIRTVSPTELAAKVNAIVVLSDHRAIPKDGWPEHYIDKVLAALLTQRNLSGRIASVTIEIAQ